MKLNIFILLLFFTIFQSKAAQIYELIKIPNLKIYQIDKENNLRYLTPKKDFITNSGINNVSCKKSNNQRVEKKYIKTGAILWQSGTARKRLFRFVFFPKVILINLLSNKVPKWKSWIPLRFVQFWTRYPFHNFPKN